MNSIALSSQWVPFQAFIKEVFGKKSRGLSMQKIKSHCHSYENESLFPIFYPGGFSCADIRTLLKARLGISFYEDLELWRSMPLWVPSKSRLYLATAIGDSRSPVNSDFYQTDRSFKMMGIKEYMLACAFWAHSHKEYEGFDRFSYTWLADKRLCGWRARGGGFHQETGKLIIHSYSGNFEFESSRFRPMIEIAL